MMSEKAQSSKISCNNMTEMAIKERDCNHKQFLLRISNPSYPDNEKSDEETRRESILFKGMRITNKDCIFKRPEYSRGLWENQFADTKYNDKSIFEIQTKKK